jgi:hypothetical protein
MRPESLDQLVVYDEAHLRRVLRNYASHYNQIRTHLSLHETAPDLAVFCIVSNVDMRI